MYDVVLLFEYPPTAVESGVVEMTRILESLEAHLPETCKGRWTCMDIHRETRRRKNWQLAIFALRTIIRVIRPPAYSSTSKDHLTDSARKASGNALILPILTNCGLSSLPSVSSQLGVVKAITTRTNATAVHATAILPVFVFPMALAAVRRYSKAQGYTRAKKIITRPPNTTLTVVARPRSYPFAHSIGLRSNLLRRTNVRARCITRIPPSNFRQRRDSNRA